MTALFADTFFYLAMINADDATHERAVALSNELDTPVVTTAWVLTEVADALASPGERNAFIALLAALRDDPEVTIVGPTEEWFEAGLKLYAHRPDKDWSLTDCISFAVMQEYGLTEALTGDHHFEQAGFRTLLKSTGRA